MLTRLLLLILASMVVEGTTYYIDFTSGNDSNDGLSTVTAWKHCPGDSTATGTPSTFIPVAGTTLRFKGGVSYVMQAAGTTGILLNWNGLPSNPIIYDGNSAGDWGTGKALLTDNNATVGHNAFISTGSRSNLTFRSLIFTNLGGSATLPIDMGSAVPANPGRGISMGQSTSDIQGMVVQDCDFGQLGYYFNQKPMSSSSIDGAGVQMFNAKSCLVTNCNFRRVAIGVNSLVGTKRTDNLTVVACTFTDSLVWPFNNSTVQNSAWQDNITAKLNTFYDFYQFDGTNWTGYGDNPHTDGIFHRNDFAHCQWGTNINFHLNLFYQTVFGGGGGTASIYLAEGTSANIYNNLFYKQGKSRVMYFVGGPVTTGGDASPQRILVLNNTVVDDFTPSEWNFGGMTGASPVASGTGSYFMWTNNIFQDLRTGSGANFIFYSANSTTANTNNLRMDYNIYRSLNTFSGHHIGWSGVLGESSINNTLSCPSCGGTRGLQHWDTNSIAADPLLVTIGSNYTTSDLNLQAGSPARMAGVNLTTLVPFLPSLDIGFNGNTQTNLGPWDLGAMPFNNSTPPPTTSTNPPVMVTGKVKFQGVIGLGVR